MSVYKYIITYYIKYITRHEHPHRYSCTSDGIEELLHLTSQHHERNRADVDQEIRSHERHQLFRLTEKGQGEIESHGKGGRWVRINEHDDFIVETDGTRTFPWRTFILADKPSKLCEPSEINAHPHVSGTYIKNHPAEEGQVVGVHNGIIENYQELKEKLLRNGYWFLNNNSYER